MSTEKKKKLNPMVIIDPDDGKEYALEFNRKSVVKCEKEGLDINTISAHSMTMVPIVFWGAFLMHHPYMTREQTDKILFDGLGGLTGDEIGYLAQLYAEPFNSLIQDEETGKNPRRMTVKI